MASSTVADLLAAWRAAERSWERLGSTDEVAVAGREVLRAWVAYHDASLGQSAQEFMLVADDEGTYVAATRGVTAVLGYEPEELIGQRIADLAAPELRSTTPEHWARFLAEGRQDGSYRVCARDGRLIGLRYQARVHHPVPGFHVSRLWLDQPPNAGLQPHG